MYNIIYYSKATQLMLEGDLELLLEESRAWNAAHGITGLLAYIEGTSDVREEARFMQVLEGTEEEVKRIFIKIRQDSRHHHITVLKNEPMEYRSFKDWTMKFETVDLSTNLHFKAFFLLDDQLLKSEEFKRSDTALNLLKSF